MATDRLTDKEQGELRRLLEHAFDGPEEFDEFLQYRLGHRVHSIAGQTDNFPRILTRVIRRANAQLWWPSLIVEARNVVPADAALLSFAAGVGLAPRVVADGRDIDDAEHLEAKVKQGGTTYDVGEWYSRLGRIIGRICLVDAGDRSGTGFLVGPDTVLTSHHVVARVLDGEVKPGDVSLHFDYRKAPDGLTVPPPTTHRLAADWRIDARPGSRHDDDPESRTDPGPDELDYALLRVADRPGDEPLGGPSDDPMAVPRGWISVPSTEHDFRTRRSIVIVQHPDGQPMQIGLESDAVIGLNRSGTRVRYTTTTSKGSSGAPCFSMDLECVALHRGAQPTSDEQSPRYNIGIPLAAIRRQAATSGADSAFAD